MGKNDILLKKGEVGFSVLRSDSIDLLFLRSVPDPFERVERDKNKTKMKKRQKFA